MLNIFLLSGLLFNLNRFYYVRDIIWGVIAAAQLKMWKSSSLVTKITVYQSVAWSVIDKLCFLNLLSFSLFRIQGSKGLRHKAALLN